VSEKALACSLRAGVGGAARLILVDTKYEFGFDEKGAIVSPTRSTHRQQPYWVSASYPARSPRASRPRRWIRISSAAGSERCDLKDPIPEIPREMCCRPRKYVTSTEQLDRQELALPDLSVRRSPASAQLEGKIFRQGRVARALNARKAARRGSEL